jgi:Fe2+ transport system protein FeoA
MNGMIVAGDEKVEENDILCKNLHSVLTAENDRRQFLMFGNRRSEIRPNLFHFEPSSLALYLHEGTDNERPPGKDKSVKRDKASTLFESSMGKDLRIRSLPSGPMKTLFLRLGINEGEVVRCFERLPGGTVVIQKNRQQIAIGRKLSKQIMVSEVDGR